MQFNVEEENLICLYHNADRRMNRPPSSRQRKK